MPDKFDPYREALVVETTTVWPEELEHLEIAERERVADALHADPSNVAHLEYIRMHSGFCRQITVTADEVEKMSK